MQRTLVEPFTTIFKQVFIHCNFFNYFFFLNSIRKAWSLDEDLMLLEESLKNQNKWSEIAKKLIGRTQHAVKNRFICVLGRSLQLSKEKIRDSIKKKEAWKWALASLEVLKCEKKEATTKNFQ